MNQEITRPEPETWSSIASTDVPDAVRKLVQDGIVTTRQACQNVGSVLKDNTDALGDIRLAAETAVTELQAKAVDNITQNMEAAWEAADAMARAQTFSELVRLQSDFTRQQLTAFANQSREFYDLSFQAAMQTTASINQASVHAFDHFKFSEK